MAQSTDRHRVLVPKHDRRRKLPDRARLSDLFVVEGLSVDAIARRYQTTPAAVRVALRRAGLRQPRSRPPLTEAEVATIRQLFEAGVRQQDIAAQIGRTQAMVSKVVRRHGWKRPTLRRGPKPKGR